MMRDGAYKKCRMFCLNKRGYTTGLVLVRPRRAARGSGTDRGVGY